MRTSLGATALTSLLAAFGCDSAASRYDYGYGDGFAAGYNTKCEIRATIVKADWDDKHYSNGYRDGYADGALHCQHEQRQ